MSDELITAIDIGSSKIATIIAKLGDTDSEPRIMGFSSVPSRGIKKGQIVDINLVTESLERSLESAERMAGSKVSSAYYTVGGPHIESVNSHGVVAIANPDAEITESDVARAVDAARAISLSSTREVIEVTAREFIVDGQAGIKNPIGMSGVRLEVNTHIITASSTNLKNVDRVLGDLGIQGIAVCFSGLASSLATLSETEKELGVVLVDIGGGKTDVCVYVEGSLSYSASIPVGSRHITNDIAVGLRTSLESAEKIKTYLSNKKNSIIKEDVNISKLGLTDGPEEISPKSVIEGIIRPRLEELYEEILSHLEKQEFITLVPAGLVITGGGAHTVGAVEGAKRIVGLPARIGMPVGISGLVDEVMDPQFAASVGLLHYAKEGVFDGQEKMNFKSFDRIFRNVSVKGSYKKVTDLFKSFIP